MESALASWDAVIIFFFLAGGFFYGVFWGRARLIVFTLSLYVSIPLSRALFLLVSPPPVVKDWFPTISFVAVVGIAYMILYVSLFRGRRLGDGGWWQVLIASFLATGLLISHLGHLLPLSLQNELSESVFRFMLSDIAYVVWLCLPLFGIYVASRRVE